MKDNILNIYAFNLGFLKTLLEGIPEERWSEQPGGMTNHPAWQVGHLCVPASAVCNVLGGDLAWFDESWRDLFGKGSQPVADASKYPDAATLVATLEQAHAAAGDALAKADAAALAAETPIERMRGRFPTVGELCVFMMIGHEALHIGQLTAWRKAAGIPSLT